MIQALLTRPNTKVLAVCVLLSAVFNYYASFILNKSYAESQFPVPYFEAQLSFSADKIQAWYQFLVENNTMHIYLATQHIDFLFILSVLFLHGSVLLILSRLFAQGSRLRRCMVYAALLAALAPIFDGLENAVSYVMIANYADFPAWLALLYSSFAAAKFAMFTFAYLVAPVAILVWAGLKLAGKNSGANSGALSN